jgi:hypothetical protein
VSCGGPTDPWCRLVIPDLIHPSTISILCAAHQRATNALAIVASRK